MGGRQRVGKRVSGVGGSESIGCGGHGEASGQKSFLLLKLRKKRVWPASEKEPSACQGGHHSLPSQKKSTLGAFFEESDLPSPHCTIFITRSLERGLPMAQMAKNLPKMQETWVWFLGQEDPLEEGMATHSGILAWRIPWTESLTGYGVAELDTTDWLNNNKQQPVIYPPVQFRSVQSCPTLCDPMNRSTPGLPVHHQLPEFTQTHAHRVGDAIQPFHHVSSPSPPAPNPSQHQGLFQWINSLHEVAKVLEFQLQHQSFQWTPRTDLL